VSGKTRLPIAERRARLVVQCALELLEAGNGAGGAGQSLLQLPLSVSEFENALRSRFGVEHPDLVFRTDSTLERARLDRRKLPGLPRVVLRQGAPRRARQCAVRANTPSEPEAP
jgi:hypothetical protein